jgi:hypothetical protein
LLPDVTIVFLNSGSHSRGDHGGEIQKTWSPMYIKDKHDYDDLNNSSIRVQGPHGSTNPEVSSSITFLEYFDARGKERALSMRSSTHLELELQSNLPCTYESVSGDINVLFLFLVSSNKGFAVRYL